MAVLQVIWAIVCMTAIANAADKKYDYYYDQKPLLLSPLLAAGKADEARRLAENKINNRTGYSGYLTTNATCGNHLFMWFFPALKQPETAPVLLWLNGGPGSTSLYGVFPEIGPWNWIKGHGFVPNKWAWTDEHSVVFIDQPVGVGFSFTEGGCYQKEVNTTTTELHSALVQFFVMFPHLRANPFYLTGESFAGHYLPLLAMEIDQTNPTATHPIKLVAILIGNAYLEAKCFDDSSYRLQIGAVTQNMHKITQFLRSMYLQLLQDRKFELADTMSGLPVSKLINEYNIMYDEIKPAFLEDFRLYLMAIRTRDLLHVGYTPFQLFNEDVYLNLKEIMQWPISHALEYILNTEKYTLVFFTGQLDAVCSPASVDCTLHGLDWPGVSDFTDASLEDWVVSGRVAAWFKNSGNLMQIIVRNAGHFVPTDQGEFALAMLKKVVQDTKELAK